MYIYLGVYVICISVYVGVLFSICRCYRYICIYLYVIYLYYNRHRYFLSIKKLERILQSIVVGPSHIALYYLHDNIKLPSRWDLMLSFVYSIFPFTEFWSIVV